MKCGITVFGENKVQELRDKTAEITEPLHWHMIGHLQANKVKYLPGKTDLIHSLDNLKLAAEIEKQAEKTGLYGDTFTGMPYLPDMDNLQKFNADQHNMLLSVINK